jgi:hypothetical protein
MSPTARRAKRPEPPRHTGRNRALAIVGLLVIISMFLSLIIVPGVNYVEPSATATLSQADLIATLIAGQPTQVFPTATQPISPTLPNVSVGTPLPSVPPSVPPGGAPTPPP